MIFKLSQCCRSNADPKPELLGTDRSLAIVYKSLPHCLWIRICKNPNSYARSDHFFTEKFHQKVIKGINVGAGRPAFSLIVCFSFIKV